MSFFYVLSFVSAGFWIWDRLILFSLCVRTRVCFPLQVGFVSVSSGIASCEKECVLNFAMLLQMKLLVPVRQPLGHPLLELFNFPVYGSSTTQTQKSVDSRPMLGYRYCACIAQDSASPAETRERPALVILPLLIVDISGLHFHMPVALSESRLSVDKLVLSPHVHTDAEPPVISMSRC